MRALTEKQKLLISLENEGLDPESIADIMGVSIPTIYNKRAAIRKGLKKGIYSNVPNIKTKVFFIKAPSWNLDLFED